MSLKNGISSVFYFHLFKRSTAYTTTITNNQKTSNFKTLKVYVSY